MTTLPDFNSATFLPNTLIDNPYFPLSPGTILSYTATENEESDDTEELEELDEIIDELEEAIEELAEDIDELEEALDPDSDGNDDDESEDDDDEDDEGEAIEIEDLIEDIEDLLEVVEEIEEDVEDIEDSLNLDDDDDDDDESDDDDDEPEDDSDIAELEEIIDELEDELEEIAEDVDEIEDALESNNSDDDDDEDDDSEEDDDGDDEDGDIEDVIEDIEDLLEVVEEIEEDVDDIEDDLGLDDDEDDGDDDLEELEEIIDELEDALEEIAEDVDELEEALDPDSDGSDDDDDDEDDDGEDDSDDDGIEDLIEDIEELLEIVEEIDEDVDDIEDALDLDDDDDDDEQDDDDDDGEDADGEFAELEEIIDELEDAIEDVADDLDDIEGALDPEDEGDDDDDDDDELDDDDDDDSEENDIEDLIEDIEDLLDVIEDMEEDVEDIEAALDLGTDSDDSSESDGESDYAFESNQVYTTFETKEILGVQATVVRDVAWEEGVLIEDTLDWYAQDTDGNVWYMGELATNYEYDDAGVFLGTNTDGSWEAGVDGALPGYLMEANPQVGDRYFQEFREGIAEDEGIVESLDEIVTLELETFENVLKIRDFTALEPDVFEFKYFAPNLGQILAEEGITEEGGEPELSPELVGTSNFADATLPVLGTTTFEDSATIDNAYFPLVPGNVYLYDGEELDSDTGEMEQERNEIFVTEDTKDILGVTTRVVRDRSYEDDLLVEEEFTYYAQDTEGNVWIMGEDSTEYEYDDNGNVIETDTSDSWIAGVDQNLPGFVALGSPEEGDAYYQRFQVGEEEELAEVVEVNNAVTIELGSFANALVVEESSVLEADESDLNYYVPGLGQVLEKEFEDGVQVGSAELVGVFRLMEGTEGRDRLKGSRTDDLIDGQGGRDKLLGKHGNDTLLGGEGHDRLHGGKGNDTLDGGPGFDKYVGGNGADTFVLRPGEGTDIICDFKVWQGDTIALGSGLGFGDLTIEPFGKSGAILSADGTELAVVHSTRFAAITESVFVAI